MENFRLLKFQNRHLYENAAKHMKAISKMEDWDYMFLTNCMMTLVQWSSYDSCTRVWIMVFVSPGLNDDSCTRMGMWRWSLWLFQWSRLSARSKSSSLSIKKYIFRIIYHCHHCVTILKLISTEVWFSGSAFQYHNGHMFLTPEAVKIYHHYFHPHLRNYQ